MARAAFQIQITGRAQLEKAFNALPAAFQRKLLRPALREGAKVLRESVRHTAQALLSTSESPAPHVADTLRVKAMKRDRSARGRIGLIVITGRREELGIRPPSAKEQVEFDRRRAEDDRGRASAKAAGRRYRAPKRKRLGPGYYPAHLEYGYIHGSTHVPGLHWMRRGLEAGRDAATAKVADELTKRLKGAVGLDNATDQEFFADVDLGGAAPAEVF